MECERTDLRIVRSYDCFDMKSDNDYAHVAWANTLNGGQDVYYTRIIPILLGVDDLASNSFGAKVVPNPFKESTTINFTIEEPANTRVEVFDLQGRRVSTLLNEEIAGRNRLGGGAYLLAVLNFCNLW